MSEKKGKPKYTKEFKQDVIEYYKSHNNTKNEVAEKFGMHPTSLKNWLRAEEKHGENAFVGSGNLHQEDAELKALKKENYDLKEENAILKKAMAIFSRKP